jgi:hypothetical protein
MSDVFIDAEEFGKLIKPGEIVRNFYRRQGAAQERERIIKLLGDKSTEIQLQAIGSSHYSAPDAWKFAKGLEYAIKLIKGENK